MLSKHRIELQDGLIAVGKDRLVWVDERPPLTNEKLFGKAAGWICLPRVGRKPTQVFTDVQPHPRAANNFSGKGRGHLPNAPRRFSIRTVA
jgi:hypothetical protein